MRRNVASNRVPINPGQASVVNIRRRTPVVPEPEVRLLSMGTIGTTSGGIDIGGGNIYHIVTVTDTYTVLSTDATVVCNKATTFTVTLPATTVATVGQVYSIKNIGAGVVTVDGYSTDEIDGELTQEVIQWNCMKIQCSSVGNWVII